MISHYYFDLHFLDISQDVGHFVHWPLDIFTSLSKFLFISSPRVFMVLGVFLYQVPPVLYIYVLDVNSLSCGCWVNHFSHFLCCLCILVIISLEIQKLHHFISSHFFVFASTCLVTGVFFEDDFL